MACDFRPFKTLEKILRNSFRLSGSHMPMWVIAKGELPDGTTKSVESPNHPSAVSRAEEVHEVGDRVVFGTA
jgi:hypothetical protein